MLIQDYLDICDPVLTFDRFMGEIELEKYLKNIPQHYTGRLRYDPVSMLKTVLFGFMANGYISLRELEDQCKINLRFMYSFYHTHIFLLMITSLLCSFDVPYIFMMTSITIIIITLSSPYRNIFVSDNFSL